MAGRGFDDFGFGVLENDVFGVAKGDNVFGALVGSVGFKLSAIGGPACFDFGGFFFGEFRLRGSLIFRGVEFCTFLALFFLGFFFLLLGEFGFGGGLHILGFVFVKFGAASQGIGVGVVGSFFMFCFGEFG